MFSQEHKINHLRNHKECDFRDLLMIKKRTSQSASSACGYYFRACLDAFHHIHPKNRHGTAKTRNMIPTAPIVLKAAIAMNSAITPTMNMITLHTLSIRGEAGFLYDPVGRIDLDRLPLLPLLDDTCEIPVPGMLVVDVRLPLVLMLEWWYLFPTDMLADFLPRFSRMPGATFKLFRNLNPILTTPPLRYNDSSRSSVYPAWSVE